MKLTTHFHPVLWSRMVEIHFRFPILLCGMVHFTFLTLPLQPNYESKTLALRVIMWDREQEFRIDIVLMASVSCSFTAQLMIMITINLTSNQYSYNFSRIHYYTPILILLFIFIFIFCFLSYNIHVIFLVTYYDVKLDLTSSWSHVFCS
jgi:hypothetical protein